MLLLPLKTLSPFPSQLWFLHAALAPWQLLFFPMEEITEEATFICDDLDGLLREVDEERARDLQEGPSNSVVHSPPQVGSQEWRRLNEIHRMCPGPG